MARIFISYSRNDQEFVDQLVPLLRQVYGNDSVWYDNNLRGGQVFWEEILGKIRVCNVFVYLISDDSVISEYCQNEFRAALHRRKKILPVLVRPVTINDNADIPEDIATRLRPLQYVDMSTGFSNADATARLYAAVSQLLPAARWDRLKTIIARVIVVTVLVSGIFVLWSVLVDGDNDDIKTNLPVEITSTEQVLPTPSDTPHPSNSPEESTLQPNIAHTETRAAIIYVTLTALADSRVYFTAMPTTATNTPTLSPELTNTPTIVTETLTPTSTPTLTPSPHWTLTAIKRATETAVATDLQEKCRAFAHTLFSYIRAFQEEFHETVDFD